MATINPVEVKGLGKNPFWASGVRIVEWLNVSESDTCTPVLLPHYVDKTIQVSGDFGTSGECTIEGSIDDATEASPTYVTLADPQGTDIAIVSADKRLETVLENVVFIRPRISAGTSVVLNIRLVAASPR